MENKDLDQGATGFFQSDWWRPLLWKVPMLLVSFGAAAGQRKLSMFGLIALGAMLIYRRQLFVRFGNVRALSLGALAIVALFWGFHGPPTDGILKELEMYAIVLAVPLAFVKLRLEHRELVQVLRGFVAVVAVFYLATLLGGVYHFFFSIHPYFQHEFLVYTDLAASVLYVEPIYLSLAGSAAAILSLQVVSNSYLRVGVVLFISFVMVLLNARTVLLVHCLLLGLFVGYRVIKDRNIKLLLAGVIGIAGIWFAWAMVGATHSKPGRELVVNIEEAWNRSKQPDLGFLDNGLALRFAQWRTATEVIGENPWFGAGTANERNVLSDANRSKGFNYLADQRLNCHNELLSLTVIFGFIGVAVLLAVYGREAFLALRRKGPYRVVYAMIVVLILGAMVTESLLNRFHGLILISFLNTVLILTSEGE